MTKLIALIFSVLTLVALPAHAQQLPVAPSLAAKSWLLLEVSSGQLLTSQAPDERIEPASLTKLMTAYLTFSAIRQKTIALNQAVPVSEKAWRTGGSKMFIKIGDQVPVEELIKGMIVQSGNDACVALAEAISGSEEAFAALMNREAARLGMSSSQFTNSTGLPDPKLRTTARDLSLLAAALIRDFPDEYAKYYSMKEYRYNNITQHNRNRLLWADPTVDGVKTGFTEAAGYCLISSAKRGPRRLLSVVLGTSSDAARASESLKLLNWGYQFFDAVQLYGKGQPVSTPRVWKGAENTVKIGFERDFIVAVPKGYANKIDAQFIVQQPLMAPIIAGQKIGSVKLVVDGKPFGDFPTVALSPVPVASFFGRAYDSMRLWFQ
ncbi:MAG: Serine-type D-Ala-D-Ala carboxypeptidase [Proteobacteria bacterium]|nr:Serine-type D-Ala-D-Ala carboxypeptidase [Pseudomonadota bacterium]